MNSHSESSRFTSCTAANSEGVVGGWWRNRQKSSATSSQLFRSELVNQSFMVTVHKLEKIRGVTVFLHRTFPEVNTNEPFVIREVDWMTTSVTTNQYFIFSSWWRVAGVVDRMMTGSALFLEVLSNIVWGIFSVWKLSYAHCTNGRVVWSHSAVTVC